MRKFAMLAVVTVMLMGLLAGCRGSGNETSAPTTAAPTTMAPTTTQAPTTTMATLPDTTSNIITEASEAITLERKIPDMDFICESENRLWGCSNDAQTIYEGYALLKGGDVMTTYTTTGAIHHRMVREDAVVVRNSKVTWAVRVCMVHTHTVMKMACKHQTKRSLMPVQLVFGRTPKTICLS